MAFEFTILHSATIQVAAILEWYDKQNKLLVLQFYQAYESAIEKLKLNPEAYSYIHKDFRRLLLEKFPYKIVYKITGNKVIIYRISHTSSDDSEWFKNAE